MLAGEPKHIGSVSLVDGPGSGEEVLPLSSGSNRTELLGVLAWDPDCPEAAKERHCTEELQKARGVQRNKGLLPCCAACSCQRSCRNTVPA